MIIGKKFFIVDMPKSGSSFLRNYFKQYKNIELTIHHETISHNKRTELLKIKRRIGLIRNPYSWYISLWNWSCKNKKGSPLYSDLTSRRLKFKRLIFNNRTLKYIVDQILKDTKILKNLFRNPKSKKNFNKFIDIMLNFKFRNLVSSDYSFIPHKNFGYMTFIFFSHHVLRKDYKALFNSNKKLEQLINDIDSKIYTNFYFKTERLNKDLKDFLIQNKIKLKNFKNIDKNKTTKMLNENLLSFYSKKNLILVEKKEEFIFKKFKYKKLSKLKT